MFAMNVPMHTGGGRLQPTQTRKSLLTGFAHRNKSVISQAVNSGVGARKDIN